MANDKDKPRTAPTGKLMLELAVPTIFAQIVNLLYNMVDRIYMGRIPGTGSIALAGLGVAFPIILLISAFSTLVGMGGVSRVSICMRQKDDEDVERTLGSSTAFSIVLSIVLSAISLIMKEPLSVMFGASEDTIVYANQYLGIYLIGTISVQAALGLDQFTICQGFTETGMMTVLIGTIINIVPDPILIFGFHMGVSEAVPATTISQTTLAIWMVVFLRSKKSMLKIRRKYLKLDRAILAPVLLLGASPFIMQSTECLVQLMSNTGMQKSRNDFYAEAMAIIFSLSQMLFLLTQGIAQGVMPTISYNYGAGNMERVKEAFQHLLTAAMVFTVADAGSFLLFPGLFVLLFSSDPEITRVAPHGMRIYLLGLITSEAQVACQQMFLALREVKIPVFLAILRKIVLSIPLAIILPRLGPSTTRLFLAESISDVLAVVTTVVMLRLNFFKIPAKAGAQKA